MSLWDLGLGFAIGQAASNKHGKGYAIAMVPLAAEFLGVTILGAELVTAWLPRSINPFVALALIAIGGVAAFLLYRYVHLLALRFLPLKIATIALSGGDLGRRALAVISRHAPRAPDPRLRRRLRPQGFYNEAPVLGATPSPA